jgi:hypothetical protein
MTPFTTLTGVVLMPAALSASHSASPRSVMFTIIRPLFFWSAVTRAVWSNHALQRTGLGFVAFERSDCFMVLFPFHALAHSTARSLSLGR